MSGFGTLSVAAATTPTVISTFFAHFFARPRRKKSSKRSLAQGGPGGGPENQLTYEEGLRIVRRFLEFASRHGLEEVQGFTAMAVPVPRELLPWVLTLPTSHSSHAIDWVKRQTVVIPEETIERATGILAQHLGSYGPEGESGGGLKLVGGSKWWRIRGRALEGEWIEVR